MLTEKRLNVIIFTEVIFLKPIAIIHSDFKEKFGIPRQSRLVDELEAKIEFLPPCNNPDCLRGLEGYSHIWLIWQFSENADAPFSPTVRPPRLGGNKRMGVFATRSPFRPNPIGLSVVKIKEIDLKTPSVTVLGADLLDGTPIYDIKPYLPHIDSIPEAEGGFATDFKDYGLKVNFPEELLSTIPEAKRKSLMAVLAQDPRPSYQNDEERIYGLSFAGYNISFKVKDQTIIVTEVKQPLD